MNKDSSIKNIKPSLLSIQGAVPIPNAVEQVGQALLPRFIRVDSREGVLLLLGWLWLGKIVLLEGQLRDLLGRLALRLIPVKVRLR